MQRRSPDEIASAIVATPLALGLVFASALLGGVAILVLALTYGAGAADGGCPEPSEVVKAAPQREIVRGATLAPTSAAPLVSGTDASRAACAEPGAAEAAGATATYGLLSGTRLGIDSPGKPVWVVTFDDACVPSGAACARADLHVVIDALSGERLASYPAS